MLTERGEKLHEDSGDQDPVDHHPPDHTVRLLRVLDVSELMRKLPISSSEYHLSTREIA
jgi:hypothetical protein